MVLRRWNTIFVSVLVTTLFMRKLSMEELGRLSVPDFKSAPKTAVTLVLDNIRSLHNVGSAFRTADAFSLEQIILTGITGTPPHREIEKTALGATQSVSWKYEERSEQAIAALKASGYHIVVVEQTDQSVPLHQFTIPMGGRLALVFGNEINGVSPEVLQHADSAVEIPQSGTKHSINVSVCIGIVVWEVVRRFRA